MNMVDALDCSSRATMPPHSVAISREMDDVTLARRALFEQIHSWSSSSPMPQLATYVWMLMLYERAVATHGGYAESVLDPGDEERVSISFIRGS